jgi:hypothetical protein
MKLTKLLLAVGALLITGSAMATSGYASLEYYDETNRTTNATNIKEALVVGTKDGSMDYSLKMENSQTSFGSGSISQGLEFRVKKSFGGFYLGGRLGERITSSSHFSHYAIDGGVKFPLFAGFTGDIGARYRNSFDTANNYETQRVHTTVAYALTKRDAVAVRWSRSWGDEKKDVWRLQYTRGF